MTRPGHVYDLRYRLQRCALVGVFAFFIGAPINAQDVQRLPVFFAITPYTVNYVNAGVIMKGDKAAAQFAHRSLLGPFNGFRTYFFEGFGFIGDTSQSSKNQFSARIVNDREGNLIQRTRAYLSYTRSLRLSERIDMSLGLSFGFINFSVGSSLSSAGGSDITPDGNTGIWIQGTKRNDFYGGLSLNQFVNGRVAPISEVHLFKRYLHFTFGKKIRLTQDFQLDNMLNYRFYSASRDISLAERLIYKERYSVGLNYVNQTSLILMAGVTHEWYPIGVFTVAAGYNFPIPSRNSIGVQSFDFSFTFAL